MVGIMTRVEWVGGVLDYGVKGIKEEVLGKYPNVEGVAALNDQ